MKYFGWFLGILALDQMTKWWIRWTLVPGQSIPVIGDVVRITYVQNSGIAFGLRVGHGILFTLLSIFAFLLIAWYGKTHWNESAWFKTGIMWILGGAVGNLVDRILFGKVVDFIDVGIWVHMKPYRWPVFNVADSAVVIGMGMLLVWMMREDPSRRSSEKAKSPIM